LLPKLIDKACSQKPMMKLRAEFVSQAQGDVLEIGIGSGLNLEYYCAETNSITGLDPAVEITELAQQRIEDIDIPFELLNLSSEEIPADDGRFDTIVCTWTMCSIPNIYQAVREMYRVLKPAGKFIFIEHGLSPDKNIAKWQARIEPAWKVIGGGCHLSRKADELLLDGGFRMDSLDSGYLPGPKFAAFMYRGVASKPG
ncbi:MAG: class I SAM-dependent methyltransferase, partial [Gammaproteobacteria bacterium]|nr:class I SAM-dependent methyltransferase [Gammaproteobacteria bacterium]